MAIDWGPHFIVPTDVIESYSGAVQLRETLDRELLAKDLAEHGLPQRVVKIANPWYYRRKGAQTWVMAGESTDDTLPAVDQDPLEAEPFVPGDVPPRGRGLGEDCTSQQRPSGDRP